MQLYLAQEGDTLEYVLRRCNMLTAHSRTVAAVEQVRDLLRSQRSFTFQVFASVTDDQEGGPTTAHYPHLQSRHRFLHHPGPRLCKSSVPIMMHPDFSSCSETVTELSCQSGHAYC